MRTILLLPALLILAACATSSASPGPEPDINIYQISRVANGPLTGRASLDFEAGGKKLQKVEVQNVGTMGD